MPRAPSSNIVRFKFTPFLAIVFLGAGVCLGGNEPDFRQIVAADFPRWDSNHDGELSPAEINASIENPQVKGEEAAAVVVIRNIFSRNKHLDSSQRLSRDQLLAFAEDPSVENNFGWDTEEINSCNHALFLPGDPDLLTVQQGPVGDCYLLAVIGALVSNNPQAVRNMIKPLTNNLFEVDFADGAKVVVPAATDAELIQGARVGENHGIWLDILEKGYAQRREGTNQVSDDGSAPTVKVPRDFLPGGKTVPNIRRFTGHKTANFWLDQANGTNAPPTVQEIHDLLVQLTQAHRLITAGKLKRGVQLPAGIVRGHCWAVVGYDPESRLVRVFNPWGNEFEPKGPPGLTNGYAVHHGVFIMPLQEFIQVFQKLNYETGQPLDN